MNKKWKKVLYEKQGFPDNYVDPSFLSNLRKNVNLYKYSWQEAFSGLCAVTHEVSSTVLFVLTFIYLKDESYPISIILSGVMGLIIISALIHQLSCAKQERWSFQASNMLSYMKSIVIFLLFGYMFSPILKVLTETISTDTIYAMVVLMMITHVIFQDYGAEAAIVSRTLSLNSALFAAVCLSSRLHTAMHTFVLVILAVKIFVLLPLLRRQLTKNKPSLILITGIFFILILVLLTDISVIYAILFLTLCIFINIICPTMFVYYQKYKENIFGPWDEAIVMEPKTSSSQKNKQKPD